MFTLSPNFYDLNNIVDSLRNESRAVVLEMVILGQWPSLGND